MDADDISLPHRFAVQVAFLDRNPDVDVCGTWFETFGTYSSVRRHAVEHSAIIEDLLHVGCVIGHPTVMLRRDALGELRYDPAFEHAEDFRLWAQMANKSRFANIPQVCLLYRTHPGQVSERRASLQRVNALRVQAFLAASVLPGLPAGSIQSLERAFTGEGGFNEAELIGLSEVLSSPGKPKGTNTARPSGSRPIASPP